MSKQDSLPAGAVGLAGAFSGVYPQASPGGWQIIGVTATRMWDLERAVPALLQPGMRVRFVDATGRLAVPVPGDATSRPAMPTTIDTTGDPTALVASDTIDRLLASALGDPDGRPAVPASIDTSERLAAPSTSDAIGGRPPPAPGDPNGQPEAPTTAPMPPGAFGLPSFDAAALEVHATGLPALFQDLGRDGQAAQGVSGSGAMDRGALRAANRLVGNPGDVACVETVGGGFAVVSRGRTVVAVAGADAPLELTTARGERRALAGYRPIALDDGDRLAIGTPRAGLRCYLAVRGGFAVAPVLGSCSTDTLARIGPPPIVAGDRLPVRPVRHGVVGAPEPKSADLPTTGRTVELDVVLGPRADWFDQDAVARLSTQEWIVTPQSDRVGLRLAGERPLARSNPAELPSEGTLAGAIQVPPSGQPVLFLADHPLTGGYPVIASVATHHLDRAGQLPVGARIRFRPISHPGPP